MKAFNVIRFGDGGETKTILASFDDEESADLSHEEFCNRFPHAYIDVLTDKELKACN